MVTESYATWRLVARGISQGSVLRAVQFIIVINDLEEATGSHSHQTHVLHKTSWENQLYSPDQGCHPEAPKPAGEMGQQEPEEVQQM